MRVCASRCVRVHSLLAHRALRTPPAETLASLTETRRRYKRISIRTRRRVSAPRRVYVRYCSYFASAARGDLRCLFDSVGRKSFRSQRRGAVLQIAEEAGERGLVGPIGRLRVVRV